MYDNRIIKDIYRCSSITSNEELYPLEKWYNQLLEKTVDEITIADVGRMLRQNVFLDLAILKSIDFLKENVFAGELYDGQLLENLSEIDSSFLLHYVDRLRMIIKDALAKIEKHDWRYDEEREEIRTVLYSLAVKVI